jgi:hypothetical protein
MTLSTQMSKMLNLRSAKGKYTNRNVKYDRLLEHPDDELIL